MEKIVCIKIDKKGLLHAKPSTSEFHQIYRLAMEVHWNNSTKTLYAPKPKEWTYLDWFKQIIKAAKESGIELTIDPNTLFDNISEELKSQIIKVYE